MPNFSNSFGPKVFYEYGIGTLRSILLLLFKGANCACRNVYTGSSSADIIFLCLIIIDNITQAYRGV